MVFRISLLTMLMALLGNCGRMPSDSLPELLRAPYLQLALGDSTVVLWRTDVGRQAEVRYKIEGESTWRRVQGKVGRTNTGWMENSAVLRQLEPAKRYTYRVFTDGHDMLDLAPSFLSPLADSSNALRFFAVGDIGEPEETEGTPGWLNDALVRDSTSYSFGLLLGDIVYPEGRSEVYDERLFRHFADYFPTTPVFPVLGNHDWHEPEENYLREWRVPGNGHYYAFRSGNVRFFALDTGPVGEVYDYDTQVAWLREGLGRQEEGIDWTVVFLHHNGQSCTYKSDYPAVISLYPLFTEFGVDLVLNGHAHTYERLNPMDGEGGVAEGGFTSITIGSGGKLRGTLGDPTPYTPDPEHCQHAGLVAKAVHDWVYLGLTVEGTSLTGTAYRTRDNTVVDRFTLAH